MKDTGVGPQQHNYCGSVIGNWPKRILLFMIVAPMGGWLSPTNAHSQTAAEGNRTVCSALGRGLFLNHSGLPQTNFLFTSARRQTQPAQSEVACMATPSGFHQSLANRNQWSSLSALAQRSNIPVFLSPGRPGAFNGRIGSLSGKTIAALSKAGFPSTPDTWVGHTGLWSVSTNWSAGIPTSTNDVLIANSGSVVTEDIAGSINNLTLSSGNSLSLNNSFNLTIGGTAISNAGNINLNSTANGTGLTISTGTVTLSGGGTITLGDRRTRQNYINLGSGPHSST